MTILARLEQWKEQGVISPDQHALLSGLSRNEPFSLFLELNILLYAGVLAFVAGLGWTAAKWSQQLGDLLILTVLSALFIACLWYCFSRASVWSPLETTSPNLVFDYVLYLGSLTWTAELAYLENRFHMLSGQWDDYLLATAALFLFFAYRFDNRFVLSLALSSLAGWFGLSLSHTPLLQDSVYRQCAILFALIVVGVGAILWRSGLKPHFLGAYLNIAANVLFWALLSGVFASQGYFVWLLPMLGACGASLAWGLSQRQFAFVACAAVYGYIGLSSVLIRGMSGDATLGWFVVTGIAMLVALVAISRRFGKERESRP